MHARIPPSIEPALPGDFAEIAELWEASVRATHHFLKEEDLLYLRPLVEHTFLKAVTLYCTRETGRITGFLGTSEDKIEMLFIHPEERGKGIGKTLLRFAMGQLGMRKVDVNEQNGLAVGFYLSCGFRVAGRTETDALGKPYPILQLELDVPE